MIWGFTDRFVICIAYVKSNSKHILFMRIYRFKIFFEIIMIIMRYIQLYLYISPPVWGGGGFWYS